MWDKNVVLWIVTVGQESNASQTLYRITEPVELKAAPIHQAEKQAAHSTIGSIKVVKRATSAELAAPSTQQNDRQLLGVMVAMNHA